MNSTFQGNPAVNGGALGSIGVFLDDLNSVFIEATRRPGTAKTRASGTEGGGLGGAIYNDGNDYTLTICGTQFTEQQANELGSGPSFRSSTT